MTVLATSSPGVIRKELAKDSFVVVMLCAMAVGMPALLALGSGALTIPHNDDFDYRRVALGLFESGEVTLTGWSQMSLIGQLYFVQPFLWISGGDPWSFAAATAVLAVAGIGAAYFLVRRIRSRPVATFSVLSLVFFPGFLVNTTSFMTDVPALAGEMVCLALGAMALDRQGVPRMRWLVGSLVVGCFAFSIREFALAAPVAVLVCVWASESGNRRPYLLVGIGVLIACAAVHVVTANLPGQRASSFELTFLNFVHVRYAAAILGLVLSPALILAVTRWWRSWRVVDAAIGCLVGIVLFRDEIQQTLATGTIPGVLIGNLLEPLGAPGGVAVGYRPILLGSPIWDVLNAIGLIAVIAGFGVVSSSIGRRLRSGDPIVARPAWIWVGSPEGLLAVFALLFGAGTVLVGMAAPIYDRYLWPLSIPLTCLLLRSVPRAPWPAMQTAPRRTAIAGAGLLTTTLALTSMAILLNSFAFDAAGWRMGEEAVRRGFAAGTVDAGMVWVGYQATGPADADATPTSSETWYDAMWPSFRLCAMVSSSLIDVPGFRLEHADIEAYRLLLFDGPQEPLYLYRFSSPGCE
jgi:hypothetical protein